MEIVRLCESFFKKCIAFGWDELTNLILPDNGNYPNLRNMILLATDNLDDWMIGLQDVNPNHVKMFLNGFSPKTKDEHVRYLFPDKDYLESLFSRKKYQDILKSNDKTAAELVIHKEIPSLNRKIDSFFNGFATDSAKDFPKKYPKPTVKHLSEQEKLRDIAMSNKDPKIRLDALKRLDDDSQYAFAHIAINDEVFANKFIAVQKLKIKEALEKIATSEFENHNIKAIAISKLNYEDSSVAIYFIAKNDKNSHNRKLALEKLPQGDGFFEFVAEFDKDTVNRRIAIDNISSSKQEFLSKIALKEHDELNRWEIIDKISDSEESLNVLKKLFRKEVFSKIRDFIENKIAKIQLRNTTPKKESQIFQDL